MISANIAPGVNRTFTAETWKHLVPASIWKDSRDEALDLETPNIETDLQGYDIDPDAIAAARANAKLAGVDHLIHFQTRPVSALSHPRKYGFLVTNPPYGERLTGAEEDSDHEAERADDGRKKNLSPAPFYFGRKKKGEKDGKEIFNS